VYDVQDADFVYSCNNPAITIKADTKIKSRTKININVSSKDSKDAKGLAQQGSKHAMLTVACPAMTSCKWCFYLEL
jgi:hypothetical protein